jgi:hypothetical protein
VRNIIHGVWGAAVLCHFRYRLRDGAPGFDAQINQIGGTGVFYDRKQLFRCGQQGTQAGGRTQHDDAQAGHQAQAGHGGAAHAMVNAVGHRQQHVGAGVAETKTRW